MWIGLVLAVAGAVLAAVAGRAADWGVPAVAAAVAAISADQARREGERIGAGPVFGTQRSLISGLIAVALVAFVLAVRSL